ncbi:hypothetical protein K493DRAFT_408479 [Basidiobolus meristosporus CBS 931.73]|uniref:Gfo/Idh/MocA-like oxidoreductase N-terminal domain-containing protein n=1 Tax=Basidiobolus meristosporus CBS 931.73 TaxID=1314790 RepID=A0A1Y1Y5J4_9FUNG|nr:hypothetical protein K493DRAFT_408479 [Basidiobolus meristosporus CBS 931.73]|eukprot:ORX93248.1 hypothetical protein K493DRAFT_408479 [Basidiobolus meristosporus CBS 931.73]
MKLVALACPTDFRRYNLAQRHAIPPEMTFSDWRELSSKPKLADAVIITSVGDRLRDKHIVVFAEKRYHILLESPVTLSLQTCKRLADSALRNQVIFAMGNTLRYSAYNLTIKRIIDSGTIGEVMNIQHVAPLGAFRLQCADSGIFSRKYRRESSSMLANSLSDVDLVAWFMGRRCRIISSFGCFFSQPSQLDNNSFVPHDSPITRTTTPTTLPNQTEDENGILSLITSDAAQPSAVNSPSEENGHQNINMEFDGDKTCSITLIACPENVLPRRTRIFGNLGELDGDGQIVRVFNFLTRRSEIIRPDVFRGGDVFNERYCGEYGLVRRFVEAIAAGGPLNGSSDADEMLDSYVYVTAAEYANKTESVVNVDDFRSRVFAET